jgi:hypothetical protein
MRLGEPQSQSGHHREEKDLMPMSAIKSQFRGHHPIACHHTNWAITTPKNLLVVAVSFLPSVRFEFSQQWMWWIQSSGKKQSDRRELIFRTNLLNWSLLEDSFYQTTEGHIPESINLLNFTMSYFHRILFTLFIFSPHSSILLVSF